MMKIKHFLGQLWGLEYQIKFFIKASKLFYFRVPLIGHFLSYVIDRVCLIIYGLDMHGHSIQVKDLAISHPSGVLLGGNGIVSTGRVVVMSGVKFGARSPKDVEYLERHKDRSVFRLGHNVVIASNSVIIGSPDICDNVVVGAMSLVNRSITEPGVYAGIPARKIADIGSSDWL